MMKKCRQPAHARQPLPARRGATLLVTLLASCASGRDPGGPATAGPGPSSAAGTRLPDPERSPTGSDRQGAGEAARLREFLAAELGADASERPGAVILVARGEEILLRTARGLANLETRRPLSVDDTLPIGSLTKSFAAAAILRLADEGALRLDDDVRLHLPEAPTAGRRVTLEELLTHTSGMPNLVDSEGFWEWAASERSTDELVARTGGMPWLAEPGEAFHYSDSGYILLGAVVERATGLSFDEYVVSELARPLGMASTRSAHRPLGDEPLGYSDGGAPDALHMSVPHASGQLASSVDDLLRWVRAWQAGEVVSPHLAQLAWAARVLPDGTVSGYGFGWKRDSLAGHELVAHGGWVPGFTATVAHLPAQQLTAVVLVNDEERPVAGYVARRCLRLLLTGSPDVRTIEVDAAQRARLVGRYRTQRGSLLHVEQVADTPQLTIRWDGDEAFPIVALTPWEFAVEESDGTWRFTFEPAQERSPSVRPSLSGEPREVARRLP